MEWVKNGNLIAKSASFYEPNSPNNPTPGKWHLRHIAALGEEPPAVKGLKPLQEEFDFSEAEGVVSFSMPVGKEDFVDFSWVDRQLPTLFQRLREYLIETAGSEVADRVIPPDALQMLVDGVAFADEPWEAIAQLRSEVEMLKEKLCEPSFTEVMKRRFEELLNKPEYSEGSMNPAFRKLIAAHMKATGKDAATLATEVGIDLKDLQPRLAGTTEFSESEAAAVVQALITTPKKSARELELEQRLADAQKREIVDFVEGLASEEQAKLLPGEVDGQVAILQALLDSADVVEFGEGDSKQSLSAFEAHKKFLTGLEKRIEYSELTRGTGEEPGDAVEFNEAPGYQVSGEKQVLYKKAVAYMKANPQCTDITQAYKAVGGR